MIGLQDRIIVALDRPDLSSALTLAEAVRPYVGAFKVGLELFTAEGPPAVRQICALGGRVFLDGKFHDIPNTAAGACRAGVCTGAWMLNVHASGGREMLKAAADAVREEGGNRPGEEPILLGVTVLTSLDRPLLAEVLGSDVDPADHVLRLALLCQECGLHGVVASAHEAAAIRKECGPGFVIVTPGIRRAGGATHDQKRSASPAEALAAGADYLVVGRDITAAPDPVAAAQAILEEMRV